MKIWITNGTFGECHNFIEKKGHGDTPTKQKYENFGMKMKEQDRKNNTWNAYR